MNVFVYQIVDKHRVQSATDLPPSCGRLRFRFVEDGGFLPDDLFVVNPCARDHNFSFLTTRARQCHHDTTNVLYVQGTRKVEERVVVRVRQTVS